MVLDQEWYMQGRLKLRHLQLLVALDDAKSVNQAARRLQITQPGASRLLAEIEAIVGGAIFERNPRGLTPNSYGEVLVRRARIVLTELNQAADELNDLRSGLGGVVGIGAVTAPAVDTVVRVIADIQRTHRYLNVTVQVDTSPQLMKSLLEGQLDFILSRVPPNTDSTLLDYREVGEEELRFLVRDDHPLLARRTLRLSEILDYPWVLQPPGTLLRQRVETMFRGAGLRPPVRVLNTPSALLTLAAIAQGEAIGVLSASVADVFCDGGRYRRLPAIPEAGRIVVEPFGLIRHTTRPFSPAAQLLYGAIEALLFPAAKAARRSGASPV